MILARAVLLATRYLPTIILAVLIVVSLVIAVNIDRRR